MYSDRQQRLSSSANVLQSEMTVGARDAMQVDMQRIVLMKVCMM
jgi:hypothetical protein